MIKTIIFDFDGVIAESVDVKTDAFCELFIEHPKEIVDSVRQYHIDNGGMSRVKKFEYYYEKLLKKPLTKETLDELCERFHDLVIDKVVNAPFVDGAKELLDKCYGKYDMFVVSGTPAEEIKEVVKKRGLSKYFKGVFGSPKKKADIITNIMDKYELKKDEVVFLGDSANDLEAAKATGIYFIARVVDFSLIWIKDSDVTVKYENLEPVFDFLEKLNKKR